jgi:hypothetical protein
MEDASAEKIARNNSVFRDANEEIEAAASGYGLGDGRAVPFLCECSDPRCMQIIRLTLDEYRRVRSNPRWFAHAPDHETAVAGVVEAVEHCGQFVLVEKVGRAGAVAVDLAGRRDSD